MSKLQELIQKFCPDGVELKRLGDQEVCVMQRGTVITKNNIIAGEIPVIAGGKNPAYYCNQANRTGETITIAGSGAYAGFVSYWNTPIFVSDAFSIKGTQLCSTKYLYYLLLNMQDKIYATKKGAGIPHVHIKDVENFKVPIPPLEVQNEIVRILDTFTSHTAELQAELQARKEQYEYYRNKLLTFDKDDKDVELKKLGEICNVQRGVRLTTRDLTSNGKYPVYHGGIEPIGYYTEYNRTANSAMIINVGASAGTVGFCQTNFWSSDGCFCFTHNNVINQKYLFYVLQSMEFIIKSKVRKAGIPTLDNKDVERINIPIIPMFEQQRIVSILNKFETLVNDLTEGLPAEIAAVQEQYEYYRNKLLSFPKIKES